MRTAGVVAAVVLAHENISPWQVAWWIACAVFLVVGALAVAHYTRRWRRDGGVRWDAPAVAVVAFGLAVLTWGLLAGYASLPLIG